MARELAYKSLLQFSHKLPPMIAWNKKKKMAANKGDAKGAQPKRAFKEVLSTPGRNNSSPAKKQARKAVEEGENGLSNASTALKSEIMDAFNAALDSKLDQLATRIEAMVTTKIEELERKFQQSASSRSCRG